MTFMPRFPLAPFLPAMPKGMVAQSNLPFRANGKFGTAGMTSAYTPVVASMEPAEKRS